MNEESRIAGFISAIFACVLGTFTLVNVFANNNNYPGYNKGVLCVLFFLVLCGYCLLLKNNNLMVLIRKKHNLIMIVAGFIVVALQVLYLVTTVCKNGWDSGVMVTNAVTTTDEYDWYFQIYPNNVFLAAIYKTICKVFNITNINLAWIVLSSLTLVCGDIGIAVLYFTVNGIYGKNAALLAFISVAGLWGLNPAIYTPYSDTIIFTLVSIIIWFGYRLLVSASALKTVIYSILIGIFLGIGYSTKPTILILLIAFVIFLFFSKINYSNIKNTKLTGILVKLLIILLIATSLFASKKLVDKGLEHFVEKNEVYEMPWTHFVMIGLNEANGTYGRFSRDDAVYTMSFHTEKEKKEANIIEIKKRIKAKGIGYITFLINKTRWFISDGTFYHQGEGNAEDYTYLNESGFAKGIISFKDVAGRMYFINKYIRQFFWFFVLVGVVLACLFNRKPDRLFFIICLVGLFAYNAVFEGNPRQIISFVSIFIILQSSLFDEKSEGLRKISKFLNKG